MTSLMVTFGDISGERIVDLCVAGACKYKDRPTTLGHILAESVIQAIAKTTKGQRWYQDEWLSDKGVERMELENLARNAFTHPLAHLVYIAGEDSTKANHHNTEAGFYGCQLSTTGWSPKSPWCRKCDYVERCKNQTAKNFHELYRLRIEEDYESD